MAKKRTPAPAKPPRKKRVTFSLHAPTANAVVLSGSFCNWDTDTHCLKKDRKGTWKAILSLTPGRYEYRFLVDGQWQNDPDCAERIWNSFGTENCIRHVD